MTIRPIRSTLIFAFCALLLSAGTAHPAGFALIEQGVSGLGNAYAGGAAVAEDATTVFFNPAGMTRLPTQAMAATHVIMPSFEFENRGSTHVLQPITGTPLLGGNGGDAGVTKVVPNLYFVRKADDRLSMGISINAPFGLATKYDRNWVGRYHAVESDLATLNVNPSLAYRFTDKLSIGGGLTVSYAKAKLTNSIDFGTITGVAPQRADGFAELEGDALGMGWNIGMLYEFSKDTRLGAAYRSKIRYTLEGDAKFSNVPAGLAPIFRNSNISAHLTTPDSLSVSLFHNLNPRWAIMGDVTWTNWRTFNELRIKFNNPGQPHSVVTTEWKDVFRYSLGATYKATEKWTLRGGVAYDQAPIASEERRTPRVPDGDRKWLAFGGGYKFTNNAELNFGYVHLFISDTRISKSVTDPEDRIRGGLTGTYTGSVNIVSAEVKWVF